MLEKLKIDGLDLGPKLVLAFVLVAVLVVLGALVLAVNLGVYGVIFVRRKKGA